MELLEGYLEKCRYCLEDLSIGKESILIDEDTDKLFQALIDTKMIISPVLSNHICKRCSTEFSRIQSFKECLMKKQTTLKELFKAYQALEAQQYDSDKLAARSELEEPEPEICSELIDVLSSEHNLIAPSNTKKGSSKFRKSQRNSVEDYPENKCPICGKQFTEKRKIPLHMKRMHVKIKDHHCEQCDYSAYTKFDVVRHVKNIHTSPTDNPAEQRICPDCGKVVKGGNNQLTLHIRKKHLQIKKFQCDFCAFASYGKYEIRSHLEHIHIPKEYKESYACQLCQSVLSSAMGLKVHILHKHSGLKPHACFCGKSFSLRETLKTHVRNVHKGERKFACQQCPKRFGQAVRLRDHINNMHGVKQEIPCTRCSKVFHSKRNLKAHLVYHDEPKYSCPEAQCGKRFYLSNKLKEHVKTHEGMEHQCSLCARTFQLLSSLKRHLKNHSNNL